MNHYHRYAVYYIPPPGPLADFGASWLGWDIATGRALPETAGRADRREPLGDASETGRGADHDRRPRNRPAADTGDTEPPAGRAAPAVARTAVSRTAVSRAARYGFHATLKPPFRLREGRDPAALHDALSLLAAECAPCPLGGVELADLGGFLALVPRADRGRPAALALLASRIVLRLDGFRAPATAEEIARRSQAGLTPRQEANLLRWGYPYVMDDFRFHLTLSDRLAPDARAELRRRLAPRLAPLLPGPDRLAAVALCGEDADGWFHLIHRYPLSG